MNNEHEGDELLVAGFPPVAAVSRTTAPLAPAALPEAAPDVGPEFRSAQTPVFLDASGRRRRLLRRLGIAAGAAVVLFLGALGVGIATGTDVPLTTWDDPPVRPQASQRPARGQDGETGAKATQGGRRLQGVRPERAVPAAPPFGAGVGASATAAPRPSTGSSPSVTPTGGPPTSPPGRAHSTPPAQGHTKKPR